MENVIIVENLSKKYTIGHQKQDDYETFRDTLSHGARCIYQRLRYPFSPNSEKIDREDFWALKDINFDVQQGDRLGIIGKNGAGKSTILKILSRITHPTTGKIHIKGRVASLLEVGTGFHPELTGRENIFLNGAILGMTKIDIRLRFDEIVAFAEIEKFLDTPVKRYSSGMYVRLAFAVAAHLEPEILIVDEVLAVGDAGFQKKCLGKMEKAGKDGRTVIFVSHNMNAIKRLCNNGIILEQGKILQYSNAQRAIDIYLDSEKPLNQTGEIIIAEKQKEKRQLSGKSKITAMRILDKDENICTEFRIHDEIYFEADLEGYGENGFTFSFSGRNALGVIVYHIRSQDSDIPLTSQTNSCRIRVKVPKIVLTEGTYSINGWLGNHLNQLEDYVSNSVHFTVLNINHSVEKLSSIVYEKGEWGVFEK